MKKILYTTLIVVYSAFLLLGCSSKSDIPDLSVEGEWEIYEKTLVCSDKKLEKEINDRFAVSLKDNNGRYEYILGSTSYSENSYKKTETGNFIRDKSLIGTYAVSGNGRVMSVKVKVSSHSWEFDADILDRNVNNILAVTQKIETKDAENILLGYFGLTRQLDDGITGELKTKARKIKE